MNTKLAWLVPTLMIISSACTAPGKAGSVLPASEGAQTISPASAGTTTPLGSSDQAITPGSVAGTTAANFSLGPYKDVTVSANWNTYQISSEVTGTATPVAQLPAIGDVTWSFATGECGAETWAGIPSDQLVQANVAAFVAAKRNYILSTGGAAGTFTCTSDAGFSTFVDRYNSSNLIGIDFDIEAGQSAADIDALVARVKTAQTNPKYSHLRFSFTVATLAGTGPGLGEVGKTLMASIQRTKLEGYLINLMVMDYGSSTATNCVLDANAVCDMGKSAVQAAMLLNQEYQVPFTQIELTPMIGGNDTIDEVFTIEGVRTLMAFVKEKKLAGVHYWSLDRDKDCPPSSASATCNTYGKAGVLGFAKAFAAAR